MTMRRATAVFILGLTASGLVPAFAAESYDPALLREMRWRMIGPFRGGRTVGAAGVPQQPGVFYVGVNNGGVWKTNDYGRIWTPIFDDQPTGSIGDVAVAPSDPNVVYVGSGEGLQRPDLSTGDGIYRSGDGGKTWTHLGLRDGQQIARVAVDPRDPDRVFAAVIGHPYGPNVERGIFRSTDGGRTWEKVLYRDENTGGMDVAIDPRDPRNVYAVLWSARQAPWEVGGSWTISANNGLYRSTDGGTTWRPARPFRLGHQEAWTQWRHVWTAPTRGDHVLMARATDRAGRTQPLVTPYNDNGYFFDAVVRHPVTVA